MLVSSPSATDPILRETVSVSSTNDVTLAVHDLGGEGPDVIICHATGFHGLAYVPFARELREQHRVWSFDFRAHGDSSIPASGLSWDGMAQDLLAVIDHVGARTTRVIGHSLGGAAALLAEAARPGAIGRAWLFEPVVFPTGFRQIGGAHPMAISASRRIPTFPSRSHAIARYATSLALGRLRADCLWAYVAHAFELSPGVDSEPADEMDRWKVALHEGPVTLKCRPENEASIFTADQEVTVDRVTGVMTPIHVVRGGRAPIAFGPHALAAGLVEQLPNAELRDVDHVGHLGPLEDPETLAAQAMTFFASTP